MNTSTKITKWFHTVNEDNFTPASYTAIVIKNFLRSIRHFRLPLDVSDTVFQKCICDAVCTFYLGKQQFRSVRGPQRNFFTPAEWSEACEECWQDMLISRYFTIDYWDNFWEVSEFGRVPQLFIDLQPFLTAVLPMYVRRSTNPLVSLGYIVKDEGAYKRSESVLEIEVEEDIDFQYMKSKKQRQLLNNSAT